MRNTTFFIVRHGESIWNTRGLVQGQHLSENHLTEKGREQVLTLARKLTHTHFDALYSSDLSRAHETAQIIAAKLHLQVRYSDRLREQSHGEHEGSKAREYDKLFTEWKQLSDEERHHYKVTERGETNNETYLRITEFLKEIAQKRKGETILIVSHGGVIRNLLVILGHGTYDSISGIDNCGYIKVESDGKRITLKETEGLKSYE